MYNVDSPHDLADWIEDDDTYWPDGVPVPDEITKHPQGQVYIDVSGQPAETALQVIKFAERAHLRFEVDSNDKVSIYEPYDDCEAEGCYADARHAGPYPELCPDHGREARKRARERGLTPDRNGRY